MCCFRLVSEAEADSFKNVVQGRAKFEMNPVYPPEGSSEATKLKWKQMFPNEKRKIFMEQELEKCTATTLVRILSTQFSESKSDV